MATIEKMLDKIIKAIDISVWFLYGANITWALINYTSSQSIKKREAALIENNKKILDALNSSDKVIFIKDGQYVIHKEHI